MMDSESASADVSTGTLGVPPTVTQSGVPPMQSGDQSLDANKRKDLQYILKQNLQRILSKYTHYVNCIRRTLEEKGVRPEDLWDTLLAMPATDQLDKAIPLVSTSRDIARMADIFHVLNTEHASFFNYGIYQFIVDYYNIDNGQEELKYPEYLKGYVQQHKVSEFITINPLLRIGDATEKITLKFDIETTCKLAKIKDLQTAIANILGLMPSALRLLDIEEGCVIVTFEICTSVAESLFNERSVLTDQQIVQFRDLSALWLECNGFKFDFTAAILLQTVDSEAEVIRQDVLEYRPRVSLQSMSCVEVADECRKCFLKKHGENGTCPHCERIHCLSKKVVLSR